MKPRSDPAADLPDDVLVAGILDGQEELFPVLVARYETRLFRFIRRYTGDSEDARDVTQEVFLKVYSALDDFDPRYKFSTWLFRIGGNAAIDHIRRRKARPASLAPPPHRAGRGAPDRPPRPAARPARGPLPRTAPAGAGRGDRPAPGRLPRADQPPSLWRAALRGDRRAEGDAPRDREKQALPGPADPPRSFAEINRIKRARWSR